MDNIRVVIVIFLLKVCLATHEDPRFNPPMPFVAKVSQNADNEVVWKLTGSDPQGLPLTYSLLNIDPAGAPFTVNPNGHIMVDPNPIFNNTNNLQVCVSNTVPITKCGQITLQIEAGNPPTFDNLPFVVTIPENTAVGSNIYTVAASDIDVPADTLSFALFDSDPNPAPFTFDPATGQVDTSINFDYETRTTYTLDFNVFDGTFLTGPETLTVQISDVNEAPVLSGMPVLPVSADEDMTGGQYPLFTVSATDPESDPLTYSITCVPAACPFGINAGTLFVDDSLGTLNYQSITSFSVTIVVSDGTLTDTDTLTIAINDVNEPPVITNLPQTITVNENEVSAALLHTVAATDPENDLLYYYIQAGPADADSFTVNNLTGEISHVANPGFDYESCPQYTIDVYVSDGKTMAQVRTLTIDVIDLDEAPVIENLPLTITVPESSTVPSILFSTYFTDVDAGNTHTISMTVSPASGVGKFTMDASGVISTVANPGFDYETLTSYTITVTVLDSTGLSDTETLTIDISNRNEPPTFATNLVTVTVPEEQGIGAAVAGVSIVANDPDGDPMTFSLTGTGSGDFYIDPAGPVLRYASNIDFDVMVAPVSYVLGLTVSDPAGESDSMSINVIVYDLNDNTPTFAQSAYQVSVEENMPALTSVVQVSASDGDSDYSGVTGAVTYYIDPANTLANTYFNINANTGVVYLSAPIDYEVYKYIAFDVYAQDGAAFVSSVPVNVTVTDLNDSPPYFLPVGRTMYNFEVPQDAEVGWLVGAIQGADIDTVSLGIEYKLKQGSPMFSLDPSTGYLTVAGTITPGRQYVMQVVVKDIGGQELESTPLTIRIDTFVACEVLFSLELIVPANRLTSGGDQEQFVNELNAAIPSGIARLVYVENQRGLEFDGVAKQNDRTDVTVMFLYDQSTEVLANVGVMNKTYYTASVLEDTLSSGSGAPASPLTAAVTNFPVVQAEPWDPMFCVEKPKYFWTETPGGLATLSLLAIAGIAGTGILMGYLSYRLFFKQATGNFSTVQASKPPVPKGPHKNDATLQDFRYNPKDEAYTFRRTEEKSKTDKSTPPTEKNRGITPVSARGISPHLY